MDQTIQPSAKTTPPVQPLVKPAPPPVSAPASTPSPAAPPVSTMPRGPIWTRGGWHSLLRPRFLAIAVLVLIGLAYGGRELWFRFTHVYEYDARVTADVVTVSSRVDGWVVEMPALEGTRVQQGQVVVRIDDRIAKLRVDGLKAQIEGIRVERARLRADVGVGVTGIAGPTGGSPDRPAGTVVIAAHDDSRRLVRTFRFVGDREMVRRQATQAALDMVRRLLMST